MNRRELLLERRVSRLEKLIKNESNKDSLRKIANSFFKMIKNDAAISSYLSDEKPECSLIDPNVISITYATDHKLDKNETAELDKSLSNIIKDFSDDIDLYTWELDVTSNRVYIILVTEASSYNYRNDDLYDDVSYHDLKKGAAWGRAQRDNRDWW